MSTYRIPFNKPFLTGDEESLVRSAMQSERWSGDGPYTKKCHELLAGTLGVGKVLLTTSCTHALEMSAVLLNIQPGDEVIMPSFTFVSTANAFVMRGAKPVFVDIRPDTLNLDEKLVERAITSRTKAIVPVHYAGVGCDMHALMEIAHRNNLPVVEDNAHGLFGKYRKQWLGTFGSLATLSFHETKNFSCGEGGALLINDPALFQRAEIIREKGTNRSRFFRGEVDKYSWVDLGSSYLPADLLAAFLYGQLSKHEEIQVRRRNVWMRYREQLGEWAVGNNIRLPVVPPECDQAWHMFYILLPDESRRARLIAHLKSRGILSVFHYLPLHLSDMGVKFGGKPGDCPVTEDVSDRLLRLPFYAQITEAEQTDVCREIKSVDLH
jgi:dTDP-4-amino-4,6-dideoxygalactose transaminase